MSSRFLCKTKYFLADLVSRQLVIYLEPVRTQGSDTAAAATDQGRAATKDCSEHSRHSITEVSPLALGNSSSSKCDFVGYSVLDWFIRSS
mmetsp:Transcript_12699/g.24634  ORF Transcript_12699/g.24634 Transcript_12699/m.24634 type:complete len:90 (-) Transcript_12699:2645-2914(-)